MLTDHGRCCFVVLLGYQPLTDGICDDVLGVVEGIAGEIVIELMQEKKGLECWRKLLGPVPTRKFVLRSR